MPTNNSNPGAIGPPSMMFPVIGLGRSNTKTGLSRFARATQDMEKRAQVGIKSHAHILHIENQCVHIRKHFRGGLVGRAVQAVDRQPGALIGGITHVRAIQCRAAEAVLGSEKSRDMDPRSEQSIQRRSQVWQDSRRHRDQSHPSGLPVGGLLMDKGIEPGFDHDQLLRLQCGVEFIAIAAIYGDHIFNEENSVRYKRDVLSGVQGKEK